MTSIRPQFIFGASDSPELCVYSSDGSKCVSIGLTDDGTLTANGVPILTEEVIGFDEYVYDDNAKLSMKTSWVNNSKTQKIKEEQYAYVWGPGWRLSVLTTKYYSGGILVKTITESITYDSNGKISTVTRTVA